jgi:hypothetical protein
MARVNRVGVSGEVVEVWCCPAVALDGCGHSPSCTFQRAVAMVELDRAGLVVFLRSVLGLDLGAWADASLVGLVRYMLDVEVGRRSFSDDAAASLAPAS